MGGGVTEESSSAGMKQLGLLPPGWKRCTKETQPGEANQTMQCWWTHATGPPHITYVPQEDLEVVKHTAILHPSTEDYFENFDGSQYLPRPWLRTVYPRD